MRSQTIHPFAMNLAGFEFHTTVNVSGGERVGGLGVSWSGLGLGNHVFPNLNVFCLL